MQGWYLRKRTKSETNLFSAKGVIIEALGGTKCTWGERGEICCDRGEIKKGKKKKSLCVHSFGTDRVVFKRRQRSGRCLPAGGEQRAASRMLERRWALWVGCHPRGKMCLELFKTHLGANFAFPGQSGARAGVGDAAPVGRSRGGTACAPRLSAPRGSGGVGLTLVPSGLSSLLSHCTSLSLLLNYF